MSTRRIYRLVLRLNDEERRLFERKSARYQTMSSMIRDAVSQFNDVQTKSKIEAMTQLKSVCTRYDQRLGWLGSNLNQAQHRANELALTGQLQPSYLQQVLLPKIQECLLLIRDIKKDLDSIYSQLLKR